MLRRTALFPPKYISIGKMHSMLNEFSLILCVLVWQKLKFVSASKKGCFYFAKSLSNASLIPLESLNIKTPHLKEPKNSTKTLSCVSSVFHAKYSCWQGEGVEEEEAGKRMAQSEPLQHSSSLVVYKPVETWNGKKVLGTTLQPSRAELQTSWYVS